MVGNRQNYSLDYNLSKNLTILNLQLFYNFPHSIKYNTFFMQSEQTLLTKTFTITNELNGIVVRASVNVPYMPASRQLNISRALSQIHANSVDIANSHIFYLDFNRKMHVFIGQYPFHQEILLKHELFLGDSIQIRFRKIVSENSISEEPCPPEPKKRKVKQRTIKEAIDSVRQWRELYQQIDEKGKRAYTLETAAQKVGFAKKTLDDYFNQLRQAQYYGFDFTRHQADKIGVLRRFVKSCQKKQKDMEQMMMQDQRCDYTGSQHEDIDQYLKDPNSSEDEDEIF